MEFLTTKKISIFFTILALASPFLHLFAGSSQEGVFGWTYMSSFLNAIGWALLPFFLGISMLLEADNKEKYVTAYRVRASIVIAIGVFYMAYNILPMSDYTKPQYYTAISVIAIFGSYFVYLISKAIKSTEEALKKITKKLFRFILITTPQRFIKPNDIPRYDNEAANLINEVSNEC